MGGNNCISSYSKYEADFKNELQIFYHLVANATVFWSDVDEVIKAHMQICVSLLNIICKHSDTERRFTNYRRLRDRYCDVRDLYRRKVDTWLQSDNDTIPNELPF